MIQGGDETQFTSDEWSEGNPYETALNDDLFHSTPKNDVEIQDINESQFKENQFSPQQFNEGRNGNIYEEDTLQNTEAHTSNSNHNEWDENTNGIDLSVPSLPEIKKTSFLQDLLGLILWGKHKRSTQYVMILDKLPLYLAAILLVVSVIVVVGSFVVGAIIIPHPTLHIQPKETQLTYHHLTGNTTLVHDILNLTPGNYQFLFYLRLPISNFTVNTFAVSKRDLKYTAHLYGRNSPNNAWKKINSFSDEHRRILQCSQAAQTVFEWDSDTNSGKYVSKTGVCNEMVIVHQSEIYYSEYRVAISLNGFGTSSIFFQGKALTRFETLDSNYVYIECIIRLAYGIISIALFAIFTLLMIRTQSFRKWSTHQKWLPILLFFQILFHNPLFFMEIVIPWVGLSIIGSMISLLFTATLMLYFLIFFHSLFTRRSERNYLLFYGLKIAYMLVWYIFVNVVFIWSRIYNRADPGSTSLNDWSNFRILQLALLSLVLIYVVWLFFYVFKAIRNAHKFRQRISSRFKVIGLMSFVVFAATLAIYALNSVFKDSIGGALFLVSHTTILVYFIVCTFTFLPSTQVAPPKLAVRPDPRKKKVIRPQPRVVETNQS